MGDAYTFVAIERDAGPQHRLGKRDQSSNDVFLEG